MIEAGTLLQKRYRLQKQIGQGGMGAVYIGTDERFGSTVAIKETFFADANFSKAFEREARLLNNLRHSALPRVSDHFSDDNGQFLVMEYIAGDDLSEMLEKQNGAFLLKDVLNWADQLLDALDFLHTQETPVVHRDIKPQNLKLTPRGQIILLDFGLAKGNPTDAQHQTAAKSVFGFSRNYASLEQMQGTGTDPRSDLYSLGATLYHLLTGVPPTDALTRAMQVLNGDKDPLIPVNELHPAIPGAITEVLQRAMALNANFRPTSAVAMRAMLAESANAIEEIGNSPIKKPATGLLTQNTEVLESIPQHNKTQSGVLKTEAQPIILSPQSSITDNSVLTKLESEKRNIQIPIQPKTATQIQPLATQPKESKRGMAIGATALGGLLLVGTAVGGLFLYNPNVFSGNVGNANTIQPQNSNSNTLLTTSSNVNVSGGNAVANVANANTSELIMIQKSTPQDKQVDKNVAESSVTKTSTPTKDVAKETEKPDTKSAKSSEKVIITDDEGNKVLEDGTVKAKDGTVISPDGKITKNGVVIVDPDADDLPARRPPPPNINPPLTREQMEKLTPQQRRKLKQMMENQRRQMGNPPTAYPKKP